MNNLKSIRIAKNIQQKMVAAELGVSIQSVNYWESGARTPSTENLIKLSKIYGVSVDSLMGNRDPGVVVVGNGSESSIAKKVAVINEKKLTTPVSVSRETRSSELSEEEKQVISMYRSLSDRNRARAYSYLEGASGSQKIFRVLKKK